MLITMFTDISMCSRTHVAAYAVWAKAEGRTLRTARLFRAAILSADLAESMAIINGLVIVKHTIAPPEGSKIIAQTDSEAALYALKNGRGQGGYLRSKLWDLLDTHRLKIEIRLVEGHQGNETPRTAVNSWCDRECKRLMREMRDKIDGTN